MPHLFSFLKLMRPYLTRLLLIVLIVGILLTPTITQAFSLTGAGTGLVGGLFWGCKSFNLYACIAGGLGGALLGGSMGDRVAGTAINWIADAVNWIASTIITLVLPMVIRLLVFAISLNTQRITDFPAVIDATTVVRDIANLFLIAILIIIAIATIVGIENYGVRRTLPLLIGIALIVNFSTVIVGLVIDSGNTAMRFLWDSSGFNKISMDQYIVRNMNLSQAMAQENEDSITNILKSSSVGGLAMTSSALAKAALYVVILLLVLLAIYIYIRLALIFILRIAAVWILIITAPIVFILGVLPFGKARLKEWWSELFNWAMLGPVVFFFLFFGLIVWTQLNSQFAGGRVVETAQGPNIAYAAEASPDLSAFSIFFILPIVMLFFMYALNASKKMANSTANALVDGAISIGKGVIFGGLALGAGAAVAGIGGNLLRRPGIKNMAQRLQRSSFKPMQNLGNRLGAAHAQVVGQDAKIAQGQSEAWEDTVAGMNEGQLERELTSRGRSRTQRQAIALAALAKNKPLSENAYRSARAIAGTDTKLEQQLNTSYLHYNPGMRNADGTLDLEKIRDYAAKKNINSNLMLQGASPEEKEQLLATMSLVWDNGDMNRITRNNRELLGEVANIHKPDSSNLELMQRIATATGYSQADVGNAFNQQRKWMENPHLRRVRGQQSAGPAPTPPPPTP